MGVDFYSLVERMRQAQRAYFRGKQPSDLALARQLEREVDAALRAEHSRQRSLFTEDAPHGR